MARGRPRSVGRPAGSSPCLGMDSLEHLPAPYSSLCEFSASLCHGHREARHLDGLVGNWATRTGPAHRAMGIVWSKFRWNLEIEISHVPFPPSASSDGRRRNAFSPFPPWSKNSLTRCQIGRNIQICGEMPSLKSSRDAPHRLYCLVHSS